MNPTTLLPELPAETPPFRGSEMDRFPPLSAEARAAAEWYASDEFARRLLAAFEQARQAAIASNPPTPVQ